MNNLLKEIIRLSYKHRFSMYYKPGLCLIRVYYGDGSQHKETGKTMNEALKKMVDFLISD